LKHSVAKAVSYPRLKLVGFQRSARALRLVTYAGSGAQTSPHPMHLVNAWAISELRADFTPSSESYQNRLSTRIFKVCPFIPELKL